MSWYSKGETYKPTGLTFLAAHDSGGGAEYFVHSSPISMIMSFDKKKGDVFLTYEIPQIKNKLGVDIGIPPKEAKRYIYQKLSERLAKQLGAPPISGKWIKGNPMDSHDINYTLTWKLSDLPNYPASGIDGRKVTGGLRDREYEKVFTMLKGQSGFLHFIANDLHFELANEKMPAGKLLPTIERVSKVFDPEGPKALLEFTPRYSEIADHFKANPVEFKKLEKTLSDHGIKDFKYMGHGRSGLFLQGADDTVVAIRGGLFGRANRQPIPHHIQPLKTFKAGDYNIEVMPKLNTRDVTSEHLTMLDNAISSYRAPDGGRYTINDGALRNIGLARDGTPYYLDGDGISKVESGALAKTTQPNQPVSQEQWLNKDGSWRQHEQFKARHEQFKSPLHQSNGQINSLPEVITEPANVVAKQIPPEPTPHTESIVAPETVTPAPKEGISKSDNTISPETATQTQKPKSTPKPEKFASNHNASSSVNIVKDNFWKRQAAGSKGLIIVGGIAALGATIYGISHAMNKKKESWVKRTSTGNDKSTSPTIG